MLVSNVLDVSQAMSLLLLLCHVIRRTFRASAIGFLFERIVRPFDASLPSAQSLRSAFALRRVG